MTNVPMIEWTNNGPVLPDEPTILDGALADIGDAFGAQLNTTNLETPQGQLASSLSEIVGDKNNFYAWLVSQIDPNYAEGIMQDAIARLYFLERHPAIATTVTCACVGAAGTIIPSGAKVQDTVKNVYASTGAATIPSGGSIDVEFQCIETGPIVCAAGTVTKIRTVVPGWDTVNNANAGTTGQDVETRQDFEIRRRTSVSLNGQHSIESIYAAVFDVDGVLDVYCNENTSGSPVDIGSTDYTLAAHSIFVSVIGGLDSDIAAAIWRKKSLGSDMNGTTTVTVYDQSGYQPPYPAYDVTFLRPTPLTIKIAVSITSNPNLPVGADTLIKNAIYSSFIGSDGTQRARIGAKIYASKFYSAVVSVNAYIEIIEILIGTTTPTANYVQVGVDQAPTISLSDITVTIV